MLGRRPCLLQHDIHEGAGGGGGGRAKKKVLVSSSVAADNLCGCSSLYTHVQDRFATLFCPCPLMRSVWTSYAPNPSMIMTDFATPSCSFLLRSVRICSQSICLMDRFSTRLCLCPLLKSVWIYAPSQSVLMDRFSTRLCACPLLKSVWICSQSILCVQYLVPICDPVVPLAVKIGFDRLPFHLCYGPVCDPALSLSAV